MPDRDHLRRLVEELRETASPKRVLAETLAEQLGCTDGTWMIELEFIDGKLRRWYRRHGPAGAVELETAG